jgi:fructoselysine and glucoselysine-specific PTS system IIB component
MIVAVRVDHRLLHGQVAFTWTKFLNSNCILLVSDDLMKDELKMQVMRMAQPTGVKLVMKSVDESIKALNAGVTEKYKLFVIVDSIENAYSLIKEYKFINELNIGGTKSSDERRQLSKAVFVSPSDEVLIKKLIDSGVKVSMQMTPSESEKNIKDLL